MVFIERLSVPYFDRPEYTIKQNGETHCRFIPCCLVTRSGKPYLAMHFALKDLFVDTKYVKDYGLFFIDPD